MAYEFCQYQSKENVIYAEVRYCPQLLIPEYLAKAEIDPSEVSKRQTWLTNVVEAVNQGLAKGEEEYGIVCRTILSCIR